LTTQFKGEFLKKKIIFPGTPFEASTKLNVYLSLKRTKRSKRTKDESHGKEREALRIQLCRKARVRKGEKHGRIFRFISLVCTPFPSIFFD